jgi:hypothetical protein
MIRYTLLDKHTIGDTLLHSRCMHAGYRTDQMCLNTSAVHLLNTAAYICSVINHIIYCITA